MFDEHRRPWGRLFYLLALCSGGGVVGTDDAGYFYHQRRCLPG